MSGTVVNTSIDDLSILDDTADVDRCRSVRRRGGVFHHHGGVGRGLEVDKVPPRSYANVRNFAL